MANGNLEIKGLKELIKEINEFKTDLAETVAEMTKMIKVANDVNSVNIKSIKTLTSLNDEQRKQTKAEEQSALMKQKTIKAANDAMYSQQKLEAQTERLTKAKQRGTQATNTWGKALDSFQAKFNTIGNFLSTTILGAIGGVVGAFKKVVEWNNEFTAALNSLGAITGLRGAELKSLGEQARETGRAINMSGAEMLGAYEKVGSLLPLLLKNKDALNEVTKQAILLSKASGGKLGLEGATEALGAVMNQFDLSADKASRAVNVLAASEVEGSATTDQLVESLKNVGAVAKGSNITLEQTGALLEVLASKQLLGSEAGTKLRGVIVKLQDAGLGYKSGIFNINDALKEYKNQLDKKKSAQEKDNFSLKTFGLENVTAGKILIENIDNFEELTKKVTGTTTAIDQAKLQTQSASEEWKKLGLQIQDFFIGETFEKFNKGIAQFTRGIINVLGGLGGTIFETLRFIGEGIYRTLDVSALASGNYLENIESFYSGFQERMATRIDWIINPLKEVTDETVKNEKLQTKVVDEDSKKQINAKKEMTEEEKALIKKMKEERDKEREELRRNSLTDIERENEDFEKRQKTAQLYIDKKAQYTKEEQLLLEQMVIEHNDRLQEIAIKARERMDGLEREADGLLLEQQDENYQLQIEQLNEIYSQKLALAQGNAEAIAELDYQYKLSLAAAEVEQNAQIYSITAKGSKEQLEAKKKLSDSILKLNDITTNHELANADKRKKAEEVLAAEKEKTTERLKTVAWSLIDTLGAVTGKEAAIAKAALVYRRAMAIAEVWIETAKSNAIITAQAGAAAIPTFGASVGIGISLIAANNIMAGIQTGLIAAQTVEDISKFREGTDDAPGGLAFVGENPSGIPGKGREIITLPDGTKYLTPDTATLTYLPAHSKVTPNHIIENELKEAAAMPNIMYQADNKRMIELLTAIRDKPANTSSITSSGIINISRQGDLTRKWINKNYRHE